MSNFSETLAADAARLSSGEDGVSRGTYFHPRFFPVVLFRIASLCYGRNRFLNLFSYVFTWMNFYLHGIEISPRVEIGKGIFLPHPNGVVIGAGSIGENVTIFQGVTLGAAEADLEFDLEKRPKVCDNVVIGSGAKIIGAVTLESDSVVGAGAVVLKDVPTGARAVGVPAKII